VLRSRWVLDASVLLATPGETKIEHLEPAITAHLDAVSEPPAAVVKTNHRENLHPAAASVLSCRVTLTIASLTQSIAWT
jgi:hypothetical protein